MDLFPHNLHHRIPGPYEQDTFRLTSLFRKRVIDRLEYPRDVDPQEPRGGGILHI